MPADGIQVETVWKQQVEKERECAQIARKYGGPPSYVMNGANLAASGGLMAIHHSHSRLEIIADKIQKKAPQDMMGEATGAEAESTAFELGAMRHAEKIPSRKWDLPHTQAQELGWLISHPVRADQLRARRLKKRYEPLASTTALISSNGSMTMLGTSSSSPCLSASQPGGPRLSPHMPAFEKSANVLMLNKPEWSKPKGQSPITKYADIYVKQMHCNPFNQSAAGR